MRERALGAWSLENPKCRKGRWQAGTRTSDCWTRVRRPARIDGPNLYLWPVFASLGLGSHTRTDVTLQMFRIHRSWS